MADQIDWATLRGTGTLTTDFNRYWTDSSSLSGLAQLVVTPTIVHRASPGVIYVSRSIGDTDVPGSIKRQRQYILEMMLRFGAPVIIKHKYEPEDVRNGVAVEAPSFSKAYGQTRSHDPTFGSGFVSVETWEREWMDPHGTILIADVAPGPDWVPAPKYRGYGPGYLTWIIEPDVTEDVFKLLNEGALTRTQTAQAQMGWWPEVHDNDLLINVELDDKGSPVAAKERYEAKMTTPVSMRGLERKGKRERGVVGAGGNRYLVQQNFEMSRVPIASEAMNVPIDR